MKKGKIWLIPSPLGEGLIRKSLASESISKIQAITHFIVENEKVSRKFLREIEVNVPQSELHIEEYGKHHKKPLEEYFLPIHQGMDIGILSDAGCPGIADPGSEIVSKAHELGIQVVPLVGPSSILLSLMASGFNGQSFSFQGYLPIEKKARKDKLRALETLAEKQNQTQIFIETPYRNLQIIQDMVESLKPLTKLCIASGITTDLEFIQTHPISYWKTHIPKLDKIPTIFLIFKS